MSEGRLPIATQFDSLLFVSWLIALVYLYLLLRDRRLNAGVFVLPVTLALIGIATILPRNEAQRTDLAVGVIGTAHGLCLLVGCVGVLVATAVALMYLVKFRQLKKGQVFSTLRLPSLERLDRMHQISVYVSWPLLTIGLGLGLALQKLSSDDPKVVSTVVAWLIMTVLAHYRYQPEHRGSRVAMLTLIAGSAVLISLLGDSVFGTAHLAKPPEVRGP